MKHPLLTYFLLSPLYFLLSTFFSAFLSGNAFAAELKSTDFPTVNAAIDACAAQGGGRVVVPAGTHETGAVRLKSDVELHLEEGATLLFSDRLEDYLPGVPVAWEGIECVNVSPLVYAYGCTNVAITGKGTLKAKMDFWWSWAGARPPDVKAVDRKLKNVWSPQNVPVAERQLWKEPNARFRPQFLHFNRCRNVRLEGVSVRGTPFWTVHFFLCRGVVARDLDINATGDNGRMINNSDGMDVDGTQDVLIERCRFCQGDDAIVLKSGKDYDGRRLASPTANVVVRDCTVVKGHNLAAVGSELSGGVRNVRISNCRIVDTVGEVLHVKTNRRRGGFVENVVIEDVVTADLRGDVLGIEGRYFFGGPGEEAFKEDFLTPIRNVTLRNIRCGKVPRLLDVRGDYLIPIEGLTIDNVRAERVSKPDYLANVKDFRRDGVPGEMTVRTRTAAELGGADLSQAIFVPELREHVLAVTDGTVGGTVVLASRDLKLWSEPIAELWPEPARLKEKVEKVALRREKRGWFMDVVFASGKAMYYTPEVFWPFKLPSSFIEKDVTPGNGFTFDFKASSDRLFPEDTTSSNLVTKIGPQDSYNPIVLPDAKCGAYRLQFRFRAKSPVGKRACPNAIVWDSKSPGSWDVFRLQPAGDVWNRYSTVFKVAEGIGRVRLQFRGDNGSQVEVKDVRVFREQPPAPGALPVELMCEPHGYVDSTFAVSQNQPAVPNFVWRRADGDRALNGKYDFVLTLSRDFTFVDSLFARDGKVVRETRSDGTTVARWRADVNPEKGFNTWARFGLMIASSASVGTKGTLALAVEAEGRRVSNEVKLDLFVIPEIRVTAPKRYRNGLIVASEKPFISLTNAEVNRRQAEFMAACGVRWIIKSATPEVYRMWRDAGIDVVMAGSPLANGYSYGNGAPLPAEDRFVPLQRLANDPWWFKNAYCPVAIYEESPFFKTNMVPHLQRHLKGTDGMWANWEPYGYAGKGCFCERCRKAFIKWSGTPESVVATNWPDAYAAGGACRAEIVPFRAWQHGRVMKTLNRYVTQFADGPQAIGFDPGIECGLLASNWEETHLFAETAATEYAKDFKWIDPWGPYSGIHSIRKVFVDSPGFRMGDFFNAVDIAAVRDAKYPDLRIHAFPNGYQCGGWMVQPELLEMNMDAYFFAGWDATTPYFFPCGYDARYWRAFANATARAAKFEDIVLEGRRIDALVSVTPDATFPAPLDYATPFWDASGGNLPGWKEPASLLQTLAWEKEGRRIVAVFNFHTASATFTLRFADTGRTEVFTVPGCRTTVLDFPSDVLPKEPVLFSAGILTDTHVGGWYTKDASHVKAAAELFRREGVDAIVNVGDVCDRHDPRFYKLYREAVDAVYPSGKPRPPEYFVYAWHDSYAYKGHKRCETVKDAPEAFRDMQAALRAANPPDAQLEIAGFPVVFFQQSQKNDYREKILVETERKYPEKPIFVFDHVPAGGTVDRSDEWGDADLRLVYDRHPRVIHVSGHIHGSLRNERNIWQGSFTSVNAGCVEVWGKNAARSYDVMTMEVRAHSVTFRRFDIRNGREIGADARWTFPLPFDPATAPYRPEARAAQATPVEFAPGGALAVSTVADKRGVRTAVTMPPLADGAVAFRYPVRVTARAMDGRPVDLFEGFADGDFYLRPSEQTGSPAVCTFPAAIVVPGERATVEAAPLGFFGPEGKPLRAEIAGAARTDGSATVFESGDPMADLSFFWGDKQGECTERAVATDGFYRRDGRMIGVLELPGYDPNAACAFRVTAEFSTRGADGISLGASVTGVEKPDWYSLASTVTSRPCEGTVKRVVFEFKPRKDVPRAGLYVWEPTTAAPCGIRFERVKIEKFN